MSNRSHWDEFDAAGQKLVHEFGVLDGVSLAASWRCGDWTWQGEVTRLGGPRSYDGQTSTGVPAVSQSEIRQHHAQLQASRNLSANWRVGARLSEQTVWRDIASTSGASGYPEQFNWALVHLGMQWQAEAGPGKLYLAAWLGVPLKSSVSVRLPGRDEATLSLGVLRQLEVSAGWDIPLSLAWRLWVKLALRRTDIAEGAPGVIRRSGVPVGIAHQPQSHVDDTPLSVGISYEF